jgi:DNA-binding MurR/RpiR family transcriptional regulator
MNTKHPTTDPSTGSGQDAPIDADLQALADEIAATTGVSPATAMRLARLQRPSLQQFAQQWDAAATRTRGLARRRRPNLLPPEESHS